MPLHFQKCTSLELNELVEISRKTFLESFEKDNDPDDFKNYIESAFGKDTIEKTNRPIGIFEWN